MKKIFILFYLISTTCLAQQSYQTTGNIERLDPSLDKIISPNAKVEIIASGFQWSEGPLWVEKYKMLLFSDVKANTIYKWTEKNGKEVYLTPSGYTGKIPRGGEMGSNGLTLDKKGRLILCQDGDRQVARMNAPLDKPAPNFIPIANSYKGKKFSSPNDVVCNHKGEIFFTDPPYGLLKQNDNDSAKELNWNGVYEVNENGRVILLIDSLTRPNGIAFLPGEKILLVSNSDPEKPNWYAFDVSEGKLKNGRIFYSAAGYNKTLRGLPDGMKVDKNGNVFAAGPGGIWIFNKNGKLLGKINLSEPASNCALSADKKTLYITNNMNVLRLIMRK